MTSSHFDLHKSLHPNMQNAFSKQPTTTENKIYLVSSQLTTMQQIIIAIFIYLPPEVPSLVYGPTLPLQLGHSQANTVLLSSFTLPLQLGHSQANTVLLDSFTLPLQLGHIQTNTVVLDSFTLPLWLGHIIDKYSCVRQFQTSPVLKLGHSQANTVVLDSFTLPLWLGHSQKNTVVLDSFTTIKCV